MLDNMTPEKVRKVLQMGKLMGETKLVEKVQQMMMPHILHVFSEHDAEKVEHFIYTDYDLVKEETPPRIKQTLKNVGSNPEMRKQWESVVLKYVTPENIKGWLRNPEQWLDTEDAEEQRRELRRCAEKIEETPGGEEWLERQVMQLYQWANIVPKSSQAPVTND